MCSAPSIIQSLWIGESLSAMEKLCMASFLQNGHSFHLYVYEEIRGVPEGVILLDANEIIPAERIFKYKDYNSYAGFSNLFRYKLLFEKGNYWVDTDVVSLSHFQSDEEHVFAGERLQQPNRMIAATSVIKAPEGSLVMEYCFRESDRQDPGSLKWGKTGPHLLTEAIAKFGMRRCVADPPVFCPINWWEWDQIINVQADAVILEQAQSVHLWNEMWRRNDIDKAGVFDQRCIFERIRISRRAAATLSYCVRPAWA